MFKIKSKLKPSILVLIAAIAGGIFVGPKYLRPEPFSFDKAPSGFVEVSKNYNSLHYKGEASVGLRVISFHNPDGGSLQFWSDDLLQKLAERGYQKVNSENVLSENQVPGIRHDFEYQIPGPNADEVNDPNRQKKKLYSVALVVSDNNRVVVELAGSGNEIKESQKTLNDIINKMNIGGCKFRESICDQT